tara:strand:+ start:495 stop:746 length:252 start_codon:yes stop_codon:yes gene_type:complete
MDISKWNNIMSSFQELLGYQKGITEVLVTKRLSKIGRKSIPDINEREEKYLVHILRKRYREINENEQTKKRDTKPSDTTRSDI